MAATTAGSVLAHQQALLRGLRRSGASDDESRILALQGELQRRLHRERQLEALLEAAQRQVTASTNEAAHLRTQLERANAEGVAASKRAAWDLRKHQEAASAAASSAAAAAAASEESLRAVVSRQASLLQKQERELSAARAQLRSIRQSVDDRALYQQQAAFLHEHLALPTAVRRSERSEGAPDDGGTPEEVGMAGKEGVAVKEGVPHEGMAETTCTAHPDRPGVPHDAAAPASATADAAREPEDANPLASPKSESLGRQQDDFIARVVATS